MSASPAIATAPLRRPKRAAATKAEDVFKSLAVTGDRERRAFSPGEPESDTSSQQGERNVGKHIAASHSGGSPVHASKGSGVDVGASTSGGDDDDGSGVLLEASDSCSSVGNRKDQTAAVVTMGRAKRSRGVMGSNKPEPSRGDRPLKSSNRHEKEKKITKPSRPPHGGNPSSAAGTVSGIARLLEGFAEFTVSGEAVGEVPDVLLSNSKVSSSSNTNNKSKKLNKNQQQPVQKEVLPANSAMALAWSALDKVLSSLPSTEILNIDSLVGNGKGATGGRGGAREGRLRVSSRNARTVSLPRERSCTGQDGCHSAEIRNRRAAAAAAAVSAFKSQQQQCQANEASGDDGCSSAAASAAARNAGLRSATLTRKSVGSPTLGLKCLDPLPAETQNGCPQQNDSGSQSDGEREGMNDDECAKARRLPPQASVKEELAECERLLEDVEASANVTLGKLTTEVDSFRYNPSSTESRQWRAWAAETLQAYGPLEQRMCVDRATRREKIAEEKRRRELQELEEKLAVCYVCDNGDYSDEDQIVFCERCCVAVHASCYNIVGVEEIGTWYCDFCDDFISKARKRLEKLERSLADAEYIPRAREASATRACNSSAKLLSPQETVKVEAGTNAKTAATDVDTASDGNTLTAKKASDKTEACNSKVQQIESAASRRLSMSTVTTNAQTSDTKAAVGAGSTSAKPPREEPSTGSSGDAVNSPGSSEEALYSPAEAEALRRGEWAPTGAVRAEAAAAAEATAKKKAGRKALTVDLKLMGDPVTAPLLLSPAERAAMEAGEWNPYFDIKPPDAKPKPAAVRKAAATGASSVEQAGAERKGNERRREQELANGARDKKPSRKNQASSGKIGSPGGEAVATVNGSVSNESADDNGEPDPAQDKLEEIIAARMKKDAWGRLQQNKRENGVPSDETRNAANKRNWDESLGVEKGAVDAATVEVPAPIAPPPSAIGTGASGSARRASPAGRRSKANGKTNRKGAAAARIGSGDDEAGLSVVPRREAENQESGEAPRGHEQEELDPEVERIAKSQRLQMEEDIADARVALEEAVELVGIEFPSQQKGPRDDDARCQLCPAIGGAFLRASKGKKHGRGLGWCHCLCALSLQLPIEDRVVQTKGYGAAEKGHTTPPCSICRRAGRGGLIPCAEEACHAKFHPLCGKESGGSAERGPHISSKDWTARCKKHALLPIVSPEPAPVVGELDKKTGAQGNRPGSSNLWKSAPKVKVAPARRSSVGGSAGIRSRVPSGGTRTRAPSLVVVDEEITRLRREAKEAATVDRKTCPAGKCHRCRKVRPWTVPCETCPQRFCASCVATQRESPFAVLEMVKAAAKDVAEGRRRPRPSFTCYVCRGICLCTTCGAKSDLAAGRLIVKPVPKPKVVLAATTAASEPAEPAPEAVEDAGPTERSATNTPNPPPPDEAAKSTSTESVSTNDVVQKSKANRATDSMTTVPSKRRSSTPALPAVDSVPAADKGTAATPAVDVANSQQAGIKRRKTGGKSLTPPPNHPHASSPAQDDIFSPKHWSPSMPTSTPGTTPRANSQQRSPDANRGRVLSADDRRWDMYYQNDSNGRMNSPHPQPPPRSSAGRSGAPANLNSYPSSSSIGGVPGSLSDAILAGSHAGVHTVANGGSVETSAQDRRVQGVLGLSQGDRMCGGMGTTGGGRHESPLKSNNVNINSVSGDNNHNRSVQGWTAYAPGNERSSPSGAAIARTAEEMQTSGAQAHNQAWEQCPEVCSFSNALAPGLNHPAAAPNAPASKVVALAIIRAQTARVRATEAALVARRAAEDMANAKAFSDRHNKAAMQKVEEATTLKDKLLLANELVSGYAGLRTNAEMAVQSAGADESAAVTRLRAAEAEAKVASAASTIANKSVIAEQGRSGLVASANGTFSWTRGNSTPSSTSSSTLSTSGGTTTEGASIASTSPTLTSDNTGRGPMSLSNALLGSDGRDNGSLSLNGGTRSPCTVGAVVVAGMSSSDAIGKSSSARWSSSGDQTQSWAPGWWTVNNSNNHHNSNRPASPSPPPMLSNIHGCVLSHHSHHSSPASSNAARGGGNDGEFARSTTPTSQACSPASTSTAMSGGGSHSTASVVRRAADAAMIAAAAEKSVAGYRAAAIAATHTAREQEANLDEIQNRLRDAEESRTKLVKYTQVASEEASKASQAAMHFEAVAKNRKADAARTAEIATRAEWEARQADWLIRRTIEEERSKAANAYFRVEGGMATAAAEAAPAVAAATVGVAAGAGLRGGLESGAMGLECHKRKAEVTGPSSSNGNARTRQKTC